MAKRLYGKDMKKRKGKKSPSNTFGTTGILGRRKKEMADKIRKATGY